MAFVMTLWGHPIVLETPGLPSRWDKHEGRPPRGVLGKDGPPMRRHAYLVAGALILAWLGSFAAADEAREPKSDASYLPAPAEVVAGPPAGCPATPGGCPADVGVAVWNSLISNHEAYAGKVGLQLGDESHCCLHPFADGGFYLMQPHVNGNPAFTVTSPVPGAAIPPARSPKFDYDLTFSPRVELGLVHDSGWGFQASWWRFDQNPDEITFFNNNPRQGAVVRSSPVAGVPGFTSPGPAATTFGLANDEVAFRSNLQLDVQEWEALYDLGGDAWWLRLSGGLRHVFMAQNYLAGRLNRGPGRSGGAAVNIVEDSDVVFSGQDFRGLGPSAGLGFRYPLGTTGLAVYGTAHGSAVFGRRHSEAFQRTVLTLQKIGGRGPSTPTRSVGLFHGEESDDDVVSSMEYEVSVEWCADCGRAKVFVRTGLIDQEWFDLGNATGGNGDVNFFGLTAMAGIRF
jgi:hypothetical protein